MFERYRVSGDPAVREEIVRRFLPLARHLAGRYAARAEREDLEQVAAVGLLKAIERFDPARGIAFSSFAVPTILGELKRYFRDLGWTVRPPRELQELALRMGRVTGTLTAQLGRSPTVSELAEECGVSAELVLEARATASAHHPESLDRPRSEDDEERVGVSLGGSDDPGFARAEAAMFVDDLVRRLPEREQMVLYLRFERDLTQAEIGREVGVSQMHVSRLLREAITRLQLEASRGDTGRHA